MESLTITAKTKEEIYQEIIPQIKEIISHESDIVANMANLSAILKEAFDFWWVGFYIVKENRDNSKQELVLGPFQGPLACTRIQYGRGVCGTTWKEKKTVIVPDVDKFPGHIACSSLSKSEIVIPIFDKKNQIYGVLDIDSKELDSFDEIDAKYLDEIVNIFNSGAL